MSPGVSGGGRVGGVRGLRREQKSSAGFWGG